MISRILHVLVFGALLPAMAMPSRGATDIVRRDWYLRETLPAIRDWEDILARWETKTPEAQRTPVFPVPANGETVVWPNPIPLTLFPENDAQKRARVRVVGDGIQVEQDGEATKKRVKTGETVVGYKHFGGGAKDQWYHRYVRKFDQLTTFRPQPAPFAVRLETPFDFRLGANQLPVSLRNTSDAPLKLTLRLQLLATRDEQTCGERTVALEKGATETARLPFALCSQGGGLLLLTIEAQGKTYWLPILTHVEDVAAVLKSVEQILADTPDDASRKRLSLLHQQVASCEDECRRRRKEANHQSPDQGSPFHEPSRNADTLVCAVPSPHDNADKSVRVTEGATRFVAPMRDYKAVEAAHEPAAGGQVARLSKVETRGVAATRLDFGKSSYVYGPDAPTPSWQDSPHVGTYDVVTWRTLFEEASALRDGLLLRRIRFDTLLFVKRKPFFSEQPFMDAHHCYNRPGGGIYRLSPVRPDGRVTPVADSIGEGIYRDLCLHWDGGQLLFAFGNAADRGAPPSGVPHNYHIYEVGADGRGLRQLTHDPKAAQRQANRNADTLVRAVGQRQNSADRSVRITPKDAFAETPPAPTEARKNDCEPFYFPDGRIGFTSDRSEQYVMCGSDIHVANLFVMNADGSGLRQFSHNVFNEFNPSILPDGRIIYDRWEYNERSVTTPHKLFTINPDGTHVAPYYGNATIRPNVIMFPRAVPDSTKVTALFTAHHGQTHGPIGLIDVRRGVDGDAPLTLLTPGVPVTGEKAEDSHHGWFSDPMPLSETTYLCSFTPTVQPWLEQTWALYVGDRHGNLALVYRDPVISCAEPVPLVVRTRPPARPLATPDTAADAAEARLLLMDVYRGLDGVPRGEAKFLRVIEDVPRVGVPVGGVIVTSATKIYTVKRILGTVPIEPDGSAYFVVPADRNVYFEVLDEKQREIQRMRSVVCLKPDEKRTCVGCHEPRQSSPPNIAFRASARAPLHPAPPPWGTQTISFLRDVQPLINAKCARCHAYDRAANGVILTDDLTDQFTVAYEELVPFISVANAMRWDHPDDVYPRPPYTYGSKVSPLTKLLEAGHHGVQLTDDEWRRLVTWMDANCVYYDRYESVYSKRSIFSEAAKGTLKTVYGRRCGRCHGQDNTGQHDSWWLSLNRRDVKLSRALQAPLARSAGGWERCDEIVFASAKDTDYQSLLASLAAIRDRLDQRPREDLLSIRGTEAERQTIALPAPPPRPAANPARPAGDWIYLSDLPWESARSGWTPNNDGLPRRDRDIENHPLRLGKRIYRKGIGTHAPSEIVYRLDGKFARFIATIGGAQERGTVVFRVFGDDKLLSDSGMMRGMEDVKTLDLSVARVQRLRLVVTDAGDNYYCDMANWADARLLKASSQQTARR